MPINYRNYHPYFKQISRFVRLIRAQGKCEGCGIANYTVQEWLDNQVRYLTHFDTVQEARRFARREGMQHVRFKDQGVWFTVIVLTTAHLDHNIENNDLDNLKALCQRCHLFHDRIDNADRRRYGRHGRFYNQVKLQLVYPTMNNNQHNQP